MIDIRKALDHLDRARNQIDKAEADLLPDPLDPPVDPPVRPPPDRPPVEPEPPDRPPVEPPDPPDGGYPVVLVGEQWPEKDEPMPRVEYANTEFQAGSRSGWFSGHAGGISDDEARSRRRPVSFKHCLFVSQDANSPPAVGPAGTYWASRAHLINGCEVDDVVIRNIFGSAYGGTPPQLPLVTSNEGHGLYWTLATMPDSRYLFNDLDVRNMGGHGLQFVTAVGAREGLDAPPEPGGEMIISNSYFENTDQCPARGSSSLSFFDLPLDVSLTNVEVHQGKGGIPYPVWGWNGDPADAYTARGCLVQRGDTLTFTADSCTFRQYGGRPDRSAVSFRGARDVVLKECQIDGLVSVNYPSSGAKNWTKRIRLIGCTGTGTLQIGKTAIGPVTQDYDLDLDGPNVS